jgi:hypothetical protein
LALNRKSIIQIFVLVLLIVGGAGAYFYQQEGGLGFITDLIGIGESTPPKVTIPKQPVKSPTSPPPSRINVEQKARPESVAIPAQPAHGEIQKAAFSVESAEIESGVLTLRQGKEPLATEVKLFLNTKPWLVPAERSFKISAQAAATDAPLVRIRWQESGQKAPRQRDFTEKYTLQLELGREQDRKVPGKIQLMLPDEDKSQIAGTFTAEVRGFRFVDGKPDLAADAIDTLQYLALREILKDDPDKPINDVSFRQGRYGAPPGYPSTGYLELEYRIGQATPIGQKFQFVKEQGAWRVIGTLRPDQLDEAHPYWIPGAKESPERLFPYLAAKRIETDVQKRLPGRSLNATEFQTRYNAKQKIGVAEVGYKVGDGQSTQTTFLYQLTPAGWTLSRELGRKERVNLATGKVETQR